jgi:hypothetical protein
MKSKEKIDELAETYSEKIMEVAYYNFPLVYPKETVSKVITALLKEYTTQCQEECNIICSKCGGDSWKFNGIKTTIKHCKCGNDF